jgi:hypothetical protein
MPAVTRSSSNSVSASAMSSKHSWTLAEDAAISACYLANMSIENTCAAFPHLNANAIEAKYRNCEYLANPKSANGFSHVSRQHASVWKAMSKENFKNNRNN